MNFIKRIIWTSLFFIGAALLFACQEGVSDSGGGRGGTQNGYVNLSITDAPIDSALEVWMQIDGVEFKPESEDPITVTFNPPLSIDLLTLQGENSLQMLFEQTLPTGVYSWLKLKITAADDGTLDSYIKLSDGDHDLDIPSGNESGLKIIGGLEVIANTATDLTIDFDLRKSIVVTGSGKYLLKPALKLVKDSETGSINGTLDPSLLTDVSCSDADPATANAVYLFEAFNTIPDDLDGIAVEPTHSALVTMNNATGAYEYSFGFIPLGKHTVAFTCQADLDDPESDDLITFIGTHNVNLVNNSTLSTDVFR